MTDRQGNAMEEGSLDPRLEALLREVASGDGPADMRARVLARIERGGATNIRARRGRLWLALPAAAVLVLALALPRILGRPPADVPVARPARGAEAIEAQPHSLDGPEIAGAAAEAARPWAAVSPAVSGRDRIVPAGSGHRPRASDDADPTLPALRIAEIDPPTAAAAEPTRTAALATPPMTLPEIEVDRLGIDPLSGTR